VDVDMLVLGLTIDRDRRVRLRPSFHFPAPMTSSHACGARFTAEFLDGHRQVLDCATLTSDCDCAGCCWPKVIRNDVPFPAGARWFLVWEGDCKLHEEEIPAPPVVRITAVQVQREGALLCWETVRDRAEPHDPCTSGTSSNGSIPPRPTGAGWPPASRRPRC
jgi:hypothetical protein